MILIINNVEKKTHFGTLFQFGNGKAIKIVTVKF